MLMSITYAEKKIFDMKCREIAVELLEMNTYENSVLLFKVLAHALKNNEPIIDSFDESIFDNIEVFQEKFSVLLHHALLQACNSNSATDSPEPISSPTRYAKEYTTKELATFFGVSMVTIHNWIKQKRFEGVDLAGDNKRNHISADTIYITPAGKRLLVCDIVHMWESEQQLVTSAPEENSLSYYSRQIEIYETKYKGKFEQTLGAKSNLSPEEQSDAQVWKHFLGRMNLEPRNSEE